MRGCAHGEGTRAEAGAEAGGAAAAGMVRGVPAAAESAGAGVLSGVPGGDVGELAAHSQTEAAMRQGIRGEHFLDEQLRPVGGTTWGVGLCIGWQHGPLGSGQDRKASNGAFVEDVIAAAKDRLCFYQATEFQCAENADAIDYLDAALAILDKRTKAREQRQVEGTHER